MTTRPIRSTLRSWLWFVVLGCVVGTIVAGAVAAVVPPGYTARVVLLVAPAAKSTPTTNDDLTAAQAYLPTLAELTTIRPVLQQVIASTGVTIDADALARQISTHVPVGTSLLEVMVTNPSPTTAAAIANGIAGELPTYATPTGGDPAGGVKLDLTVVDPAQPPTERDGPALPIRAALGGAIALFLTLSIAFLIENVGRGAQSVGRSVEALSQRDESQLRPTPPPVDRWPATAPMLEHPGGRSAPPQTASQPIYQRPSSAALAPSATIGPTAAEIFARRAAARLEPSPTTAPRANGDGALPPSFAIGGSGTTARTRPVAADGASPPPAGRAPQVATSPAAPSATNQPATSILGPAGTAMPRAAVMPSAAREPTAVETPEPFATVGSGPSSVAKSPFAGEVDRMSANREPGAPTPREASPRQDVVGVRDRAVDPTTNKGVRTPPDDAGAGSDGATRSAGDAVDAASATGQGQRSSRTPRTASRRKRS